MQCFRFSKGGGGALGGGMEEDEVAGRVWLGSPSIYTIHINTVCLVSDRTLLK